MKKRFISYLLRSHWKPLSVALAAVIVEGGTDLLEPWPIKIVLDYVIGSHHLPGWAAHFVSSTFGENKLATLNFAALSVVTIAAVGAVASYTEDYLTAKVGQGVTLDLRQKLYHHIQRLSLSFYDRSKTGDLIGRVTSDVDAIQGFVSSALLGVLVDVLTLVGMLAVMFYVNWQFTLIALSVAPVLFLEVYCMTHRIKQATRAIRKKESDIVSVVEETLSSIRVVKAFAREDYEENRLKQETIESMEMTLRARRIKARLSPIVDIIVAAGTCLVLWFGARFALAGQLTAGGLVVFLLYLGKMYKPMRDLSKMTDTISKAFIGAERITEVIQAESQTADLPHARAAHRFVGDIEFSQVSFGYELGQSVLRDINLRVEAGQFAAIVGPTGEGKSTLIGLIARFYDPLSGQVKIDGVDVRNFKLESLRRQISFVMQETPLFRAPIWQNIAYGKPGASREEIIRAASLANAVEFIERMPEGYDTLVGERGVTLSGGQRQRIAIARAIIRDSPILILDEPTTGLDAHSERLVLETLGRLMAGRTSIVVAHDLMSVRNADVIFVLQGGIVVESGTHQELTARDGLYAQLYRIQLGQEPQASLYAGLRHLN